MAATRWAVKLPTKEKVKNRDNCPHNFGFGTTLSVAAGLSAGITRRDAFEKKRRCVTSSPRSLFLKLFRLCELLSRRVNSKHSDALFFLVRTALQPSTRCPREKLVSLCKRVKKGLRWCRSVVVFISQLHYSQGGRCSLQRQSHHFVVVKSNCTMAARPAD